MFKNDFKLTQSYLLSKKERIEIFKCLKHQVHIYDSESLEYISLNYLNISVQKITIDDTKKRILISDNNPIFFEYDKEIFYPTVYLMNMFPNLIIKKVFIYDETDSFLDNGADLMLKGILNRDDIKKNVPFKMNDIFMVITITGVVTSLGSALISTSTMNINQPSGKFLKILQRINDSLWKLGTRKIPEVVYFNEKNIEVVKENEPELIISEVVDVDLDPLHEQPQLESMPLIEIDKISTVKNEELIVKKRSQTDSIGIGIDIHSKLTGEEEKSDLTEAEYDTNIDIVFLTLINLYLKENKETILPMDPGKLLKEYLKPLSVELNLPIDFKLSSYKKINNYLKSLHKDRNLINFGKIKNMQNDYITSILWEHPLITDFKPRIKKIKFLQDNSSSDEQKENIILKQDEKIEVAQLFKPNQTIKPLFEQYDKSYDNSSYYSIKHCNDVLISYLKANDLFLKDSRVKLNEILIKMLFKCKYEKDSSVGGLNGNHLESCLMDEILLKWKKNLNEKSFITKTGANNEQTIFTNNNLKVKILTRKIGNKNVTIIDGLQNFTNVKDVIKIFSKHFACSVTLKDFQNFKDAVFIQGYWVTELVEILQNEIKLKKEFIEIEDKLKLKNKKK